GVRHWYGRWWSGGDGQIGLDGGPVVPEVPGRLGDQVTGRGVVEPPQRQCRVLYELQRGEVLPHEGRLAEFDLGHGDVGVLRDVAGEKRDEVAHLRAGVLVVIGVPEQQDTVPPLRVGQRGDLTVAELVEVVAGRGRHRHLVEVHLGQLQQARIPL